MAPDIAVGMAGAPGRQGATISRGRTEPVPRGAYRHNPTRGGYDPMTAIVGGFWDSMLAEGRRWWITANSDSHIHWSEGGLDFWPGEFNKTYVFAEKTHEDILAGIRAGKIFVTSGDLIIELFVTVRQGRRKAALGETLMASTKRSIDVEVKFRDPEQANGSGNNPSVSRLDIIVGQVVGYHDDASTDSHQHVKVVKRFERAELKRRGDQFIARYRLPEPDSPLYIRVRGTNTEHLEPQPDEIGEDPWSDLWFYSNTIFVELKN